MTATDSQVRTSMCERSKGRTQEQAAASARVSSSGISFDRYDCDEHERAALEGSAIGQHWLDCSAPRTG